MENLAKLAETIYSEGSRRLGTETHDQQKEKNWEDNIS